MRLSLWILWQALATVTLAFSVPPKDYLLRQYFVVEIDTFHSQKNLHSFITQNNESYRFEHPVRGFDDHFVFSVAKDHPHLQFLGNYNSDNYNVMKRDGFEDAFDAVTAHPGLKSVQMLYPKKLERRMPVPLEQKRSLDIVDSLQKPAQEVSEKLDINDPIFLEQWHLVNTQYPGNDVNVKNLWYNGITGKGVTVAVIDDGLDHDLKDLHDNFNAKGLWDFNDNTNLPTPRLFDDYHGTRCAGEIAAVKNDVCGIGVAYEGNVAGIRILSAAISAEEEAAAMIYGMDHNDIYLCLWGPTDNGKTVAAPDLIVKKAMVKGVQEGRGNKGSLYVFASGNGGRSEDQCNFDGYTNLIYSITVGAIDYKGIHPNYAERCLAVMVVTYSSGSGEHIHTTDIKKQCSASHGGTSAAAPLAAGIYALVLQANPELTWRDVQHVSARAAVPVNEDDGSYQETALGLKYSHKYGYGKIDAEKLVEEAKKWKNVKPQAWFYSDVETVDKEINSMPTEENEPIVSTITVTKDDLKVSNVEKVEHITVKINIELLFRGMIMVKLTSPSGITSVLAEPRPLDLLNAGLNDWIFMSVAHLGEDGLGDWRLEVNSDHGHNVLKLKDWQLRIFGESIDASKAEKYDVTKDYAAERRSKTGSSSSVSSASTVSSASSTAVSSSSAAPSSSASSTSSAVSSASSSSTTAFVSSSKTETSTSSTASETSETSPTSDPLETDEPDANKHYAADHAGQYFMALAVIGFLVAIITMKCHKLPGSTRRRRREDYEFDIIPGEDYSDSDDSADGRTERDHLFDEFNAELLPEYEDDMFQIGDDEEHDRAPEDTDKKVKPETTQSGNSEGPSGDNAATGNSSEDNTKKDADQEQSSEGAGNH